MAIEGLIAIFIVMVCIFVVVAIAAPSSTRRYRSDLSNLYIAGKVRALAEEDKIDLDVEYKKFRQYYKKKIAEEKGIDHSI